MKRNTRSVVSALLMTMITVCSTYAFSGLGQEVVVQETVFISVAADSVINFTVGDDRGTGVSVPDLFVFTFACSIAADTSVSLVLFNVVDGHQSHIGADSLIFTPTTSDGWNSETRVVRPLGPNMRAVVSTSQLASTPAKFRFSYRTLSQR